MGDLKFAVYDKEKNEIRLSGNEKQHIGSWFDANCNLSIADWKDKVFLRFTGLQDSKGEDIYEGYIVYIAGVGNVEVKFEAGSFMFGGNFYHEIIEDLENIVGNIYQNKGITLD